MLDKYLDRYRYPIYAVLCVFFALIFALLVWLLILKPEHDRQAAAMAGVDAQIAQAVVGNTRDAGRIALDQVRREAEIDEQTRNSRDAILSAPGAHDPINPALHDAALERICLRDAARRDPACVKLRRANP
jgi:hypothetical protein